VGEKAAPPHDCLEKEALSSKKMQGSTMIAPLGFGRNETGEAREEGGQPQAERLGLRYTSGVAHRAIGAHVSRP
ncbi:MAG: hypothetical protein AAF968_23965, partial [Pseudomonadota bacterium]